MLARRGIFSTVTVQLVEMYFDTTRYSTGILPAGRYQALRIDLGGNARHGKNWWCVLYPGCAALPAAPTPCRRKTIWCAGGMWCGSSVWSGGSG